MLALLGKTLDALIRLLPAAMARLLVLAILLGALLLHLSALRRISTVERAQDHLETQNTHVLKAVTELTAEVRGYREDIREENKTLKARGSAGR